MSGKTSKKTKTTTKSGRSKAKPTAAPATSPKPRDGTKQAQVIGMLRSAKGATIEEMAKATGWQNHTVRGALAGALKKRLGLTISSEKDDNRGRVYRIAS
jgi:cell division septation protein DedD